jgi:hypothetical protein
MTEDIDKWEYRGTDKNPNGDDINHVWVHPCGNKVWLFETEFGGSPYVTYEWGHGFVTNKHGNGHSPFPALNFDSEKEGIEWAKEYMKQRPEGKKYGDREKENFRFE